MAVLVNEKKPRFISPTQVGAKLGSGREADFLRIDVLALGVGDSIYFGSDGKDDILLSENGHEQTFTTERRRAFPHMITESGEQPEEIFRNSRKAGTIIDDYSLLKLQVPRFRHAKRITSTRCAGS